MKLLIHRTQGVPVDRKLSPLGLLEDEKKLSPGAVGVGETTASPAAWPHKRVGWPLVVKVVTVHEIPWKDHIEIAAPRIFSIALKRILESGTPVVQLWGSPGGEAHSTAIARTITSAAFTISGFETLPVIEPE
jgi:hypothetical protein